MTGGRQRSIAVVAAVLAGGYLWLRGGVEFSVGRASEPAVAVPDALAPGLDRATFAAGCFWCVEADFDALGGVVSTTSGYTGGRTPDPTYGDVSRGRTGHAEAVEIVYDPAQTSYQRLLDHFWRNVDPFTGHRQFCDVGDQYRPAIFHHTELQRQLAVASKASVEARFGATVVVQILEAGPFHVAEPAHQNYAASHRIRYRYYRWACGRDRRLAEVWARARP